MNHFYGHPVEIKSMVSLVKGMNLFLSRSQESPFCYIWHTYVYVLEYTHTTHIHTSIFWILNVPSKAHVLKAWSPGCGATRPVEPLGGGTQWYEVR
jgi:hypothetical protein